MEKINEECLKNKIKAQIDYYGGIENVSSLVFTTYDFDTEFFENQLLPYLFNINNESNIKNKELYIAKEIEKNLRFNISDNEFGVNLTVFFDHFINDVQANINYHAIPIDDKCLHAKIIMIVGKPPKKKKKVAKIMILSGNLSISSYSSNQEICGIVETNNENIVDSIEKIFDKNDLYETLLKINELDEVIITGLPNQNENKMICNLENCKKIKVITPFIEKEVIKKIIKKRINLEILFTNLRGISNKDSFKEIIDYNIMNLYTGERKIHSKIYLIENEGLNVIIGSHNFTNNAIYLNGNIEASIIIKNNNEIYNAINEYYKRLDKENLTINNYDSEIRENEIDNWNCKYISKAVIDWEEEKALIFLDNYNKNIYPQNLILTEIGNNVLDNNNKVIFERFNEHYQLDFSQQIDIKYKLMNSKVFKVRVDNDDYIGIFYELQRLEKDKVLGNESFFDMIDTKLNGNYLNKSFDEESGANTNFEEVRSSNSSEVEEELEIYDTLKLFRFFYKANNELKKASNKDKEEKTKYINPNSNEILLFNYLKLFYNENIIVNLNNFDDNKLLYCLLAANELDIFLNDNEKMIKYKELDLEKIFELLKKESVRRIKDNLLNKSKKQKKNKDNFNEDNQADQYSKYAEDILNKYLEFIKNNPDNGGENGNN